MNTIRLLATLVICNSIFFAWLFSIWKTEGWLNLSLKFILFIGVIGNVVAAYHILSSMQ